MEKRTERNVDFDKSGWKTEASSIQTVVEIAVAIEVTWTKGHMQIFDCVSDEQNFVQETKCHVGIASK